MLEEVQDILCSKKNRFPKEGWKRLEELKSMLEKGEITESAFEARVWAVADFYDNIKQKERWWDSSDERSIFFRPVIITPENENEYGRATLVKKPY